MMETVPQKGQQLGPTYLISGFARDTFAREVVLGYPVAGK